jgi:colanic acid/amylovoran biosynthesis glycosyltransferase
MKMSSPRRIAYLSTRFPGLSETFVLNEVIRMVEQGLDVTVFSLRHANRTSAFNTQAQSILDRVVTIPFYSWRPLVKFLFLLLAHPVSIFWVIIQTFVFNFKQPAIMFRLLASLPGILYYGNRMLKDFVEHLHVHFATTPAWGAWVIKTVYGIPWSMTVHAHDIYLNHAMLQKKMDSAEFMVTNSQYNIDYLQKVHPKYPKEKLNLIHTGIDSDRFQPLVTEVTPDIPQILAVGRLDPTKGYRYLVEVIQELRQRGIVTQTHVVGHITDEAYVQEEFKYIQELIRKYQLEDDITFEQGIPQDLLLQRYREASLFILPCVVDETGNSDGLPSVLVEAMLLQKPIVSTRISGIPELVTSGKTGWLCEPGNVKELADACEDIVKQSAQAVAIAAQGRKHALENWNLTTTSRQMFQLLAESR